MPWGDRTGPMGWGPMTGRAAGYCSGYGLPGYLNPLPGRGWWPGRGWGLGWWRPRHWYYATGLPGWARFGYAPGWSAPPAFMYGAYCPLPTKEQQVTLLRQQADWLRHTQEAINRRLEELQEQEG